MPDAVSQLAVQMNDSQDFERARSAQRELWHRVHRAGRVGAEAERTALVAELIPLLRDDQSSAVRREVLWMLSEIGGDDCVSPMAGLLQHPELREDARMTIQRIPGAASLAALQQGLATVPEDFRVNMAQSLRARGVAVPGLPCEKLKPTKLTQVQPVGRATESGAK